MKRGEAALMQDATACRKLVRVVDVCLLRVFEPSGKRILVEVAEEFADGRKRDTGRLPGTKQRPHESLMHTAQRIVATIMKMSDCEVRFNWEKRELMEEAEESPSYPGMHTVYRKHVVEGRVSTSNASILERVGLRKGAFAEFSNEADRKDTKFWNWYSPKECEAKQMKVYGTDAKATFSSLVQAPLDFSETYCRDLLKSRGVDVSSFGQGEARSLAELAEEMCQGESILMETPKGDVVRVADTVLLRVQDLSTGNILVEAVHVAADGKETQPCRLPEAKKRPSENVFNTARRIVVAVLKMGEDDVYVRLGKKELIQEEQRAAEYPGIPTL